MEQWGPINGEIHFFREARSGAPVLIIDKILAHSSIRFLWTGRSCPLVRQTNTRGEI